MRRLLRGLILAAVAVGHPSVASAQGWGYRHYRPPYYAGYRGYGPGPYYGAPYYGYRYYPRPIVPYYGPAPYPVYAAPVVPGPVYGYPGVGVGISTPNFAIGFGS